MTDYKNIFGKPVKFLATDPDNAEAEGQIWYNSTADAFKNVLVNEAWSSAANQTQTQRDGGYGQSTPSSASWFAGGVDSSRNSTTTQEWNGSGWSNGGNINTGREEITGFGLVSAATLAGGATYPPSALKNEVEEYDGSSWTAATALPAKRKQAAGAGTQTAGLVSFGAVDPPSAAGSINATALEYDGSSWTSGGTGNTARSQISGCGTQTAALAFGGHTSPSTAFPAATEEYDGSSWTTGGTMNIARGLMAGNGIQTSALAYAGFTPYSAKTEAYDGTAWTNKPDLATARDRAHGGGSDSSNGLCAGGLTSPGVISVVEEFNRSVNVITGAAFASGGNLNTGRGFAAAATQGSQNSALHIGGWAPPTGARTLTEEYDGTSWSEVNDLGTAQYYLAGAGTQTAALGFGGYTTPPAVITAKTVEYDGTNWTNGGDLNTARIQLAGAGTQTAGLAMGGENPPTPSSQTAVEEYNGTAWTSVNSKSTPTTSSTATGIQTAALSLGGPTVATELYDGTNWTSGGNMNLIRTAGAAATGTQTLGLIAKGNLPPGTNLTTNTEKFDGTTFASSASVTTGAQFASGTGATIGGVIHGGGIPLTGTNSTEEFTPESSALNIKTLTTS